ncbi:MAG TPA: hypothetical protein VFP77_03880 [Gemmatimonadaceae bacterium]|jgi:hypothetical protein|nr:hypothetical protein [Gemmatimonadaceae bacterium]
MHFPEVFFGTLRQHYILLFSAAGGIAMVAGFVGAWIGSHFAGRRSGRLIATELATQVAEAPQFQQLMQAMDVLSVEVERVSESQRFVARILSEQAERDRMASLPVRQRKPEHITPH